MRASIARLAEKCQLNAPNFAEGQFLCAVVVKIRQRRLQRQLVADRTQAADHTYGDIREIGMLAEILAGVDVGEVHLDEGYPHRQQGIAQGNAGVRERRRVEDDEIDVFVGSGVDVVDEFGFGVGLEGEQPYAQLLGALAQALVD